MNALSEKLFYIQQLTQDIVNQPNTPLYSVVDRGSGLMQVTPSRLAQAITTTSRDAYCRLLEQFPIHEFNPYINVFMKSVFACDLWDCIHRHDALNKLNDLYQVGIDYEVMLDLMNRMETCVFRIRQEANSVDFKKLIYNANRVAKNNLEGTMRYIDSLFEHYSRLLVVRLDLGYQQGNYIQCHDDREAKYWEAKNDFKHLLNNAKMNSLFDHLVGHIWTLEYGPDKGFHYHVFLFFDGSQVRHDVHLARMIGDYWEHSITGNRGAYWNCNAEKDGYFRCGIGMIHFNDVEKINYLKQAAAYLVKVDHYARLLTPDHGRTFGRGTILPPRTATVGRPRCSGLQSEVMA